MKLLSALFIFPIFAGLAFAQAPDKIVTFNRADTEHCKVIVASGTPLLQSTYDGTSVAIAMPIKRANGDFSVFVSISYAQHGTIQVDPSTPCTPTRTTPGFSFTTRRARSSRRRAPRAEIRRSPPPIRKSIPDP